MAGRTDLYRGISKGVNCVQLGYVLGNISLVAPADMHHVSYSICTCVHTYMYVRMYVCMYVCTDGWMYVYVCI